jgi:hypothetical protein
LWRRRKPIVGSTGEVYLREARGYRGIFPETLGFLPPSAKHPDPALIAAFGMPHEIEPGVLASITDDAVFGVHLIRLLPDGSDRRRDIDDAKITIGRHCCPAIS